MYIWSLDMCKEFNLHSDQETYPGHVNDLLSTEKWVQCRKFLIST